MSLPPIRRFTLGDFPTAQQAWLPKLLYPLNQLLNAFFSTVDNGITLQQNTLGQIANVTVSMSGTSTLTGSAKINWTFGQTPPIGVICMNAQQINSPTTVVFYPSIGWSYNSGVVTTQFSMANPTGTGQTTINYTFTLWISGG